MAEHGPELDGKWFRCPECNHTGPFPVVNDGPLYQCPNPDCEIRLRGEQFYNRLPVG